MKKFKVKFQWLWLGLLVLVLAVSAVLVMFSAQLFAAKSFFSNSKSTADVHLEGNTLQVDLQIDPAERQGFVDFSNSLGVNQDWLEGIAVTLDQPTADQIRPYLPQKVKIYANGQSLGFYNSLNLSLSDANIKSSAPSQNIEWKAGMNGRLSYHGQSGIDLVMLSPHELLAEATTSGNLNLAPGLYDSLWPLATKLGRIELHLGSGFLRGALGVR